MPKMPIVFLERVLRKDRNWFVVFVDMQGDYENRCMIGEGPTEAMAQRNALACAREIVDRVSRLEISRLTVEDGAVRILPEGKS